MTSPRTLALLTFLLFAAALKARERTLYLAHVERRNRRIRRLTEEEIQRGLR